MKSETGRGFKEARAQFEVLRARWPQAFPLEAREVRPLETAAIDEMGWSRAYARAVVAAWKNRNAYCHAVLAYPTRFRLDGSKTDEPVDDIARDHARRDIASNHERKLAREAQAAARKEPAAEKPAAREESIPKPELPKATCPPELIEGLNLEEEEDRIRFRL